jgi:NAD(P)-dependent dehydrogenase (short-subunit alcohol dehydrogenase family)
MVADLRRTAAVRETVEAWGCIDVLVNNAGTDATKSVAELEFAEWDRVLRANLYGPFAAAT